MVDTTVHIACGPPIVNLGARLPAATDRLLLQWGTTANPMGCLFQRVGPGITSAFLRLRPSTSPRSAFSSSILIAIDNEYSSLKSAGGHRQTCIYDEVAQQKTAPPPWRSGPFHFQPVGLSAASCVQSDRSPVILLELVQVERI